MSQTAAATASTGAAYKKVIGGGLKLKGGPAKTSAAASSKRRATATGASIDLAPGTERALGLDRTRFKKEEGGAPPAAAASSSAASSSTAAPASSSALPPPPVVLSAAAAASAPASSWNLHKSELHEIDANLAALREQDRAIERLDAAGKKAAVASEKRAIEAQVAMMVQQSQLAPGVVFSVPNAANLNREYLYRKEATVSDATARLNARAGKKADRYCK